MNDDAVRYGFDALVPSEIARKAEQAGRAKVAVGFFQTFALAVLAGAFIALGAVFSATVTTGAAGELPFGVVRLLGGLSFCLGLVLVVCAGAELFTGNNLIIMAWAHGKVTTARLLRNWGIVYVGNLVGALLTAVGMIFTEYHLGDGGAVGAGVLATAQRKVGFTFGQAVMLGVFCNALVCLAVWLCMGARSTTGRILAILFPITAFVAAGFEHSVANMYFIPAGLFLKSGADPVFWNTIGQAPGDYAQLNWGSFLSANLLPVTIGNVVGGAIMVGLVYWYVYLRRHPASPED